MFKVPTHKNGFGVEDCESRKLKLVDCLVCHWQDLPADSGTARVQICAVSSRCLQWLRAQVEIFSPDQIRSDQWLRGAPRISPQSYIYTP